MHRFLLLCIIFLQSQAADHESALVLETPDAFMQRLRAQEQKCSKKSEFNRFLLGKTVEGYIRPGSAKTSMHENGYGLYYDYFIKLTSSTLLSPAKKIEEPLVLIPPFQEFSAEKKSNILKKWAHVPDPTYPLKRAVVAGIIHSEKVAINNEQGVQLLVAAAIYDDTSMALMLLGYKVNPNGSFEGGFPLGCCNSVKTAQVMIEAGADVDKVKGVYGGNWLAIQFRMYCTDHREEQKKENLLRLLLSHVQLNESNEHGLLYMREIARPYFRDWDVNLRTLENCLRILLEYNCNYDLDTKSKICGLAAGKKSSEAKKRIEDLFERYENLGKGTKRANK